MEDKGISQYKLIREYHISTSLIDKLKHNKNLRLSTLDDLCMILHCGLDEIVECIPKQDIKK